MIRLLWLHFGILIAACAAFSPYARADILFLDLNGSVNEIPAAKAAALARHENLIVVPKHSLSTADRKLMTDLEKQRLSLLDKENEAIEKINKERTAENQDLLNKAQTELRDFEARSAERLRPYRFKIEELQSALAALTQSHGKLSTVILSGHSNGYVYFGDRTEGKVSLSDIENVLHKTGHGTINALFLWGCYSATPAAVEENQRLFPTLKVVVGFGKKGPADSNPFSAQLLKDFLIVENRETQRLAGLDALETLEKVKNASAVSTVIANCESYLDLQSHTATSIKDLKADCEGANNFLEGKWEAAFMKYAFPSDPSILDPPDPDQTPNSDLRGFYNDLQKFLHCHPRFSIESTLALIFWKNVRENIERYYRDILRDFRADVSAVNSKGAKCPSLPSVSTLTRRDVVQLGLQEFYGCVERARILKLDPALVDRLQQNWFTLNKAIVNLQCVPADWVIKGASLSSPSGC